MSIQLAPISDDAFDSATSGATELLRLRPDLLGNTPPIDVSVPQPLYVMSLEEARRKAMPSNYGVVRFLLSRGESIVGAVEVARLEENGFEVNAVEVEPTHAASFERAIEGLERMSPVDRRPFELRAIRIPSLYVMALWLHGESEDFVSVLGPVFLPFKERTYSLDNFLSLAQIRASAPAAALSEASLA